MGAVTERTYIKESEYITMENTILINEALDTLRKVVPGREYGVPERQFKRIKRKLGRMYDEIFYKGPRTLPEEKP